VSRKQNMPHQDDFVVLFVFGVILGKLRLDRIRTVEASVQWQRKSAGNPVATAEQSVRAERGQRVSKAKAVTRTALLKLLNPYNPSFILFPYTRCAFSSLRRLM
jgi:hypothetical protein